MQPTFDKMCFTVGGFTDISCWYNWRTDGGPSILFAIFSHESDVLLLILLGVCTRMAPGRIVKLSLDRPSALNASERPTGGIVAPKNRLTQR